MSRSIWKGPFSESYIFKEIYLAKKSNLKQKIILLRSKNSIIFPLFVGNIFSVYNGHKFVNIVVNKDMVGYKFGEFITTRKKAMHNNKK